MDFFRRIFCISLLFLLPAAYACSHVVVKATDGTVVVGRTLEFAPPLASEIITSPRGREIKTTATDGKPTLQWKGKYGYLYLNGFHLNFAVDGMNEKGLSIGGLYLPGFTEYQKLLPGKENVALPYTRLGDWILGNFSTVAELKAALSNIIVFAKPLALAGHGEVVFPLHLIATDATGKSIVIEFLKGKMHVEDSPLGVLTNSPPLNWQRLNLKNYASLSPYSPKPVTVDGIQYASTSQGSGLFGLPGDTTSPSRFVKLSILSLTALPVAAAEDALSLAVHIINTVDIPLGMVRAEKGSQQPAESTQWSVFKDLTHRVLYFRSYANPNLQQIVLDKLNLTPGAPVSKMPVATPLSIKDATQELSSAQ